MDTRRVVVPPLKAKEAGRDGRKHTLASFPENESGQVLVRLLCIKDGCGCSGVYTLEELLIHVGYFKVEGKKGAA